MPTLTWTYIFGALTLVSILATALVLYVHDDRISNVSLGGAGVTALGLTLFGFMTWWTFDAGHHIYELTSCSKSMFVSTTDGTPFTELSATGQEIVRKTHAAGGEYQSLAKTSDFEYVKDAVTATPVEYQGDCYAVVARAGGMNFDGLILLLPALAVGLFATWVGLSKIVSGSFAPLLFGPAAAGGIALWLLWVVTPVLSSALGWLVALPISIGVAVLWHRITPLARVRDRLRSLRARI